MVATNQEMRTFDSSATRTVATPTRFWDETKPSFKTTELMVLIAAVAGVLVASRMDDSLDGQWAWTLVAALAIGYMLSRGLAKAGSSHRADDDASR
jgi:hypothetical protein